MPDEGFLNLLKPPGMTSHDVVDFVRRQLGLRRVGHLGTLDPAAAGVLPVAVGRATRLAETAGHADKAYRALVVFGITTDTLDAEGRVTGSADATSLTAPQVREALAGLQGEQEQVPPAYSAAQVGGKRLHALARKGIAITAPPRRVRIGSVELVEFTPGAMATALVDVVCSAGTYVRVLAADLGRTAGCGASLGFLLRTRSGRFPLEEAATLEELAGSPGRFLLPPDWPLVDLPAVSLAPGEAKAFASGLRSRVAMDPGPRVRVYCDMAFLGVGEVIAEGWLQPKVVLTSAQEAAGCA